MSNMEGCHKIWYKYLDHDINKLISILHTTLGGDKSSGKKCCANSSCLPVVTLKGIIAMLLMTHVVLWTDQWEWFATFATNLKKLWGIRVLSCMLLLLSSISARYRYVGSGEIPKGQDICNIIRILRVNNGVLAAKRPYRPVEAERTLILLSDRSPL